MPNRPISKRKGLTALPEISFRLGLNTIQTNRLLLLEGECAELTNVDLATFGGVGIRNVPKEIVTGLGYVRSIYRVRERIFVHHGTVLSEINAYNYVRTDLLTGLSYTQPACMVAINDWLYVSDGTSKKKVRISTGASYEWGIDRPIDIPTARAGAGSADISGTYNLYFTWVAKFSDNSEIETDLSPMGTVSVASTPIDWDVLPDPPDTQITHVRLYRDKTGGTLTQDMKTLLANIKAKEDATNAAVIAAGAGRFNRRLYGATLQRESEEKIAADTAQSQNTILGPFQVAELPMPDPNLGWADPVLSDSYADAELETLIPFVSDGRLPVWAWKHFIYKNKRVFGILAPNHTNSLWWGQPYEPDSLETSWDGFNSTTFNDDDDTALVVWDDNIYVGAKSGWIRLRGDSPSDWRFEEVKSTAVGPLTNQSCASIPGGIVFPRKEGIYRFDGYTSIQFIPKINNMMDNVNWASIAKAFTVWDGRFIRFFYPQGSATENNRELVIDTIIQDMRVAESDVAYSAGYFDRANQAFIYGTADGTILMGAGGGSRTLTIVTKEYLAGEGLDAGSKGVLHYDIDTKGVDVTITAIYDGVEQTPFTINHNGRKRTSHSLPKGSPYRIGLKITVTTDQDVILYEPWWFE